MESSVAGVPALVMVISWLPSRVVKALGDTDVTKVVVKVTCSPVSSQAGVTAVPAWKHTPVDVGVRDRGVAWTEAVATKCMAST